MNLLRNAADALRERAAPRRIVLHSQRVGGFVRVDVDDNGPGWPAAPEAAMTEWPAQPGTAAGAIGLGLRVSRDLVERAGGALTCGASPLGGARVRVTLPALRR